MQGDAAQRDYKAAAGPKLNCLEMWGATSAEKALSQVSTGLHGNKHQVHRIGLQLEYGSPC